MGGFTLIYTNEMRAAIRGIKNPTPLAYDVAQKNDQLFLLVDKNEFKRLTKNQKADFRAYIKQVVSVIEFGGAKVSVSVLE